MAQRVGRGIALLFHGRGTRRGEWSAAGPGRTLLHGKDPVPIVQEAWWVITYSCVRKLLRYLYYAYKI